MCTYEKYHYFLGNSLLYFLGEWFRFQNPWIPLMHSRKKLHKTQCVILPNPYKNLGKLQGINLPLKIKHSLYIRTFKPNFLFSLRLRGPINNFDPQRASNFVPQKMKIPNAEKRDRTGHCFQTRLVSSIPPEGVSLVRLFAINSGKIRADITVHSGTTSWNHASALRILQIAFENDNELWNTSRRVVPKNINKVMSYTYSITKCIEKIGEFSSIVTPLYFEIFTGYE